MFWHYFDIGIRALALFFALRFVISYSKVNWKAYLEGRHLMHFTWMVIAFLMLTLGFFIFGPNDSYFWITRALFVWLAYLLYQRGKLQRRRQREKNSDSTKPEVNHPVESEQQEEGKHGHYLG